MSPQPTKQVFHSVFLGNVIRARVLPGFVMFVFDKIALRTGAITKTVSEKA